MALNKSSLLIRDLKTSGRFSGIYTYSGAFLVTILLRKKESADASMIKNNKE